METGVDYVALVDDPAIIRTWQAFNSQTSHFKFFEQGDRRIVMGPLMIPNMPIYRNDEVHGEHYVMYSKDAIEKIVRKFFRQKNTGNVNLMHQPSATLSDVYMIESWVTDSTRGIHPPDGMNNYPEGTWFGTYRIENDSVWNEVKAGTFKGFSVEGFFQYAQQEDVNAENIDNLLVAILEGTKEGNDYLSNNKQFMNNPFSKISKEKLAAVKALLFSDNATEPTTNTNEAITTDGKQVFADGGWVQGSKVFMMTEQGKIPAPDGTLELDTNISCEVMNGVIMNVTEKQVQNAQEKNQGQEELLKIEETEFAKNIAANLQEVRDLLNTMKEQFNSFNEKFSASEKTIGELKAQVTKVDNASKQIFSLVEDLDKAPATTDVNDPDLKDKNQDKREKEAWEIRAEALEQIKMKKVS